MIPQIPRFVVAPGSHGTHHVIDRGATGNQRAVIDRRDDERSAQIRAAIRSLLQAFADGMTGEADMNPAEPVSE